MAAAKTKRETRKPKPSAAAAVRARVTTFDGMRLVALLGVRADDRRLSKVLRELGDTDGILGSRTLPPSIELKKLGIVLRFEGMLLDARLRQIQFELRRRWTGHSRYPGKLPYGLSSDLLAADRMHALAGHARKVTPADDWCYYDCPDHQVAIGYGKTFVETVFVIAK